MQNDKNDVKRQMDEHEHFVAIDERIPNVVNDDNENYVYRRSHTTRKFTWEEEQIARGN